MKLLYMSYIRLFTQRLLVRFQDHVSQLHVYRVILVTGTENRHYSWVAIMHITKFSHLLNTVPVSIKVSDLCHDFLPCRVIAVPNV